MNTNCSHKKIEFVKEVHYDYENNDETFSYKEEYVNAFEDVDIHRFKCIICNKFFYYSKAARDFYENGITDPREWLQASFKKKI